MTLNDRAQDKMSGFDICVLDIYRIYSSEHPGHSFNFEFSKGGAYWREVFFQGRHSLNILKKHQNTFNLSLESNNKNSNISRRIKCLMFKIVCKTPLFTKEKQHYKLNQLYYRTFLCIYHMSTPFKYYFSKSTSFERKEKHSFEGGAHQIFHIKKGVLIRGRPSFKHRCSFE